MEPKTAEFIRSIDRAIEVAERVTTEQPDRLENLIRVLGTLRERVLAGQLEPSGGTTTLGLTRDVADWIDALDSPLLEAVGAIERHYQRSWP
ncbi:hypothetical protein V0288_17500 [Pannus brasiliensis CCIBt3594]|uniref:Uncharacterized protein n=1 Tax=Pannus brasiliensis CCIBt3594 TaxID=1427578 RepID=A0AAW9QWK0_9CHRO